MTKLNGAAGAETLLSPPSKALPHVTTPGVAAEPDFSKAIAAEMQLLDRAEAAYAMHGEEIRKAVEAMIGDWPNADSN
jgi:hypothetical protein